MATKANEDLLVDVARSSTASHMERIVRSYRHLNAAIDQAAGDADALYRDRFLSTRWNDDGSLSIRATLPPAEGQLVWEALQRARDALCRDGAAPITP